MSSVCPTCGRRVRVNYGRSETSREASAGRKLTIKPESDRHRALATYMGVAPDGLTDAELAAKADGRLGTAPWMRCSEFRAMQLIGPHFQLDGGVVKRMNEATGRRQQVNYLSRLGYHVLKRLDAGEPYVWIE